MSLKSRVCYSCTIFQAVNKNKVTDDTVAICHSGYKEEANENIGNLATLSIERFGQKTKRWFTCEAIEEANIQIYDQVSNTIEVDEDKLKAERDLFASFGDSSTEAEQRRAETNGETLPAYDGGFESDISSDDEDEPKQKTVLDLNLLISTITKHNRYSGMDDNNSIGTCATGLPNAITEILQEANYTAFDQIINTDHSTVVSAVIESTHYASPQHSKDSCVTLGNGLFRHGSSPPPPSSTPMDLEKDKSGDDIELGSNGTINDNQDKEKSEHSQEINAHDTMTPNS